MRCSSCRGCSRRLTFAAGAAQWLAEAVATFGLLLVVLGHRRPRMPRGWWPPGSAPPIGLPPPRRLPTRRSLIARSLSDTFAGIRPTDVPGFIAAQLVGALAGGPGCEIPVQRRPRGRCLCYGPRGITRWLECGATPMSERPIPVTIYHNPVCGTSRNTWA